MVCEVGMGMDGSGNTLAPNLTLNLDILLLRFSESQRNEEYKQVTYVIIRNIQDLRSVYHYYCRLGHNRVQNTNSLMTRLQFWRFIKDSQFHHHGHCVPEMDRTIARCLKRRHAHQPTDRLSLQEFLSALVILSHMIYRKKYTNSKSSKLSSGTKQNPPSSARSSTVLSKCVQNLITDHIKKHAGKVKGHFLFEPRRAINALAYMERSWRLYKRLATPHELPPHETTLKMRRFLLALKDLRAIGPYLQAQTVIELLASDDPGVHKDGNYNLEIEMTFLEFFEALIGCAINFVSKDMIKQFQGEFAAVTTPRLKSEGGQTDTGTNRPGSARPKSHVSRRSNRRSSSSSIKSIEEDDDSSSTTSTLVDSQKSQINKEKNEQTTSNNLQLPGEPVGKIEHITLAKIEADDRSTHSGWKHLFDDEEEPEEPKVLLNKPKDSEVQKREEEFNLWSSQLHLFFNMHLFPAFRKLELLQLEASKARR